MYHHWGENIQKGVLGVSSFGEEKEKKEDKADTNKDKVEVIYRMLVHEKLIKPLPEDKEDGPNLKHRLVLWITAQLPDDHELIK